MESFFAHIHCMENTWVRIRRSTLGMIWKTMGITYLYKFHVYSNFSGPRLIRISYGSYILHSKKFDQYFWLHFHIWNLYGCTHKESFFAHIHSMENVWVRRSTLGMIWENYRDNLPIQIPCLFKIFLVLSWYGFHMGVTCLIPKKSLINFWPYFHRWNLYGALISVPQLVPDKTLLYLMVSSCTYDTRSMQCIQKQKKILSKNDAYVTKI